MAFGTGFSKAPEPTTLEFSKRKKRVRLGHKITGEAKGQGKR